MLLLRIATPCFLLLMTGVSGAPQIRGGQERRRNQEEVTKAASGLHVLEHFGLNPRDYVVAGGSTPSFKPCKSVKTCLELTAIMGEIDDTFLQGNVECTDVSDCAKLHPGAECRLTTQGFKCDGPGTTYCKFPCVENNFAQANIIP